MGIVIVMGYPAAGKTTLVQGYVDLAYARFNRDEFGGSVPALHKRVDEWLGAMRHNMAVLDNTYPTVESRADIIEIARKHGKRIKCVWLKTSIEDAQVNMCHRLWDHFGYIPGPDEIKAAKHPNLFPPGALFGYRKKFEPPTTEEGFYEVEEVEFTRTPYWQRQSVFFDDDLSVTVPTGKALILDYDGTLRRTKSGDKFPVTPDDIEILPRTREVLQRYQDRGYLLLGASNQSGVHKGTLTAEQAQVCFEETNRLIGLDIEILFCPHRSAPLSCYCRKPMPGMAVHWIRKHNLDPSRVIMVGDYTSDKTFAKRAGIQYVDETEFFGRK